MTCEPEEDIGHSDPSWNVRRRRAIGEKQERRIRRIVREELAAIEAEREATGRERQKRERAAELAGTREADERLLAEVEASPDRPRGLAEKVEIAFALLRQDERAATKPVASPAPEAGGQALPDRRP